MSRRLGAAAAWALRDCRSMPCWTWSSSCSWHHSEVPIRPGRPVVRAKANELLCEACIDYEPAAEGEDLGCLVAVTDDARSQLVHYALTGGPSDVAAGVRHAIALFRGRDASAQSRRSGDLQPRSGPRGTPCAHQGACRQAGEGALFEIADRFDLRHRRAGRRGEYDEVFLDWIFWVVPGHGGPDQPADRVAGPRVSLEGGAHSRSGDGDRLCADSAAGDGVRRRVFGRGRNMCEVHHAFCNG